MPRNASPRAGPSTVEWTATMARRPVGGSWKKTIIFRFNFTDGAWPLSGLALDASGNIFGTTEFETAFTIFAPALMMPLHSASRPTMNPFTS